MIWGVRPSLTIPTATDEKIGVHDGDDLGCGMSARVVVGSPDMTVKDAARLLRGNAVGCLPVIDGKQLEEDYLVDGITTENLPRQEVPAGHVIVMGDNQ